MRKAIMIWSTILITSVLGYAAATRIIDADQIKSSDHTKTFSFPAATDTLLGRISTDTVTNKSMSGSTNTFTNIPLATAVTGTLANANTTGTSAKTANTLALRDAAGNFAAAAVSGDVLALPTTTSSVGQITVNGTRYFHAYGGNLFAGSGAGNFTTTSTQTVAIGEGAGAGLTSGGFNSFIGWLAGTSTTIGVNNTYIGGLAGQYNTSGSYNTAGGFGALQNRSNGSGNTAYGYNTLNVHSSGADNAAFGNSSQQTGGTINQSTSIGALSLQFGAGTGNTVAGYGAGLTANTANATTTGNYGTYLGWLAGAGKSTQINHSTALGAEALVSADNTVAIGSSVDKTVVAGSIATSTLTVNGPVQVSGDSTSCTSTIGGAIRYTSNQFDMCDGTQWRRNLSLVAGGSSVDPSQGGTGRTSLTANNVVIGNGTASVKLVAGSASGDVLAYNGTTWTNNPGYPLTTKGDLYTYQTAPTRLPVGTNSYVLISDSSQATGLRWGPGVLTSNSVPIRVESARIGGVTNDITACTTGTCTIWRQTGFIASSGATRTGTGSYSISFANSWQSAPSCTLTGASSDSVVFRLESISTSTVVISSRNPTSVTDTAFDIICVGNN